jgi:hypothetical protein
MPYGVGGQRTYNGVAILAKANEPILTRDRLPGGPADDQSRYVEAAVQGCCLTKVGLTPCAFAILMNQCSHSGITKGTSGNVIPDCASIPVIEQTCRGTADRCGRGPLRARRGPCQRSHAGMGNVAAALTGERRGNCPRRASTPGGIWMPKQTGRGGLAPTRCLNTTGNALTLRPAGRRRQRPPESLGRGRRTPGTEKAPSPRRSAGEGHVGRGFALWPAG